MWAASARLSVILVCVFFLSMPVQADVVGTWGINGTVNEKVTIKGEGSFRESMAITDQFVFGEDGSFTMTGIPGGSGTWASVGKKKVAIYLNDGVLETYWKDLLEQMLADEGIVAEAQNLTVTKNVFTGTDNTKQDTIKGKWTLAFDAYLYIPAADTGFDMKVKATTAFGGTRNWTTASFSGPWLLSPNDSAGDIYIIGDGAGSITDWGGFGALSGTYSVTPDGLFSATFNQVNDAPVVIEGSFTSPNTIAITSPKLGTAYKISDTSACSGTWSGSFLETDGPMHVVEFSVGNDGRVSGFTGITGPVSGRMFCQGGVAVAFFHTGADMDDPYNQIGLDGTKTADHIAGFLYLDSDTRGGTFILDKQ